MPSFPTWIQSKYYNDLRQGNHQKKYKIYKYIYYTCNRLPKKNLLKNPVSLNSHQAGS